MPPLPNSNSTPYPPNQSMPTAMPFGAGFVPSPAAYPPSSTTGYPPSQPYPQMPNPYMSNIPSHCPTTNVFGGGMPVAAAAPAGGGYPPNPSMHAPHNSYPRQQTPIYPQTPFSAQGYSGHGFQQASTSTSAVYPNVNNMAACFSEMQGHIRDVRRSKVRVCVPAPKNKMCSLLIASNFSVQSEANTNKGYPIPVHTKYSVIKT